MNNLICAWYTNTYSCISPVSKGLLGLGRSRTDGGFSLNSNSNLSSTISG